MMQGFILLIASVNEDTKHMNDKEKQHITLRRDDGVTAHTTTWQTVSGKWTVSIEIIEADGIYTDFDELYGHATRDAAYDAARTYLDNYEVIDYE